MCTCNKKLARNKQKFFKAKKIGCMFRETQPYKVSWYVGFLIIVHAVYGIMSWLVPDKHAQILSVVFSVPKPPLLIWS